MMMTLGAVPLAKAKLSLAAHRGASFTHPENTLPAFAASKVVADYVEFDIRVGADGEFYVLHDENVDRTTNGTGAIASLTAADLATMEAGVRFGAKFAGVRIPTAVEALREIQTDAAPMMEFKSGTVDQAEALLQRVPWRSDGLIISFNREWLAELKQRRPDIRVGWLGAGALTITKIETAARQGIHLIGWREDDLQSDIVDQVHAHGLVIFAWTVNNPARWVLLDHMGVDGIVTDMVELADAVGPFAGPPIKVPVTSVDTEELSATPQRRFVLESGAEGKERRRVIWRRGNDQTVVGQSGTFFAPALDPNARQTYWAEWIGRDGLTRMRSFELTEADREGGLVNLSARVSVGVGDRTPVVGWVTVGPHPTPYLVRGVGSGIEEFGVHDAVGPLDLSLFTDGIFAPWPNFDAASTLIVNQTTARLGAFPLVPGKGDVGHVSALGQGSHTVHLRSRTGRNGTGLLEVYRDGTTEVAEANRLTNLSFRGYVPEAGNLVAGFVIDGPGSQLVLVRGVGPGLRRFGIKETMADPWLRLVDRRGVVIATSDDWSQDDDSRLVQQAQPLTGSPEIMIVGSRDAALLLNLQPGVYTVILESVNPAAAGVALLELFHLDGLPEPPL